MIITDDFVYIHMPKTGGTFVTEGIRAVYQSGIRSSLLGRLPKRVQRTMRRGFTEINKHGTCNEIPEPHRGKPIVASVRNPYDRYVSLYEFRWWKRYPPCDVQRIRQIYPRFPDLTFEEYVNLWNSIILPTKVTDVDFTDAQNFGVQTWQFVDFFFRDPKAVYPEIGEEYISLRKYELDMFDVHFIRTDRLNTELHDFLIEVGHSRKDVEFILDMPKIYPPEGGRGGELTWEQYYTPRLKRTVRTKERLIFAIFPEFDL